MKKEGKKWAKGKYPPTSAGSMRRLLTTGVTVPFPVSNISNNQESQETSNDLGPAQNVDCKGNWIRKPPDALFT